MGWWPEHSVYSWNRATFGRLSGNITKAGGDFQTMTVAANVVYAGCHCNDWNYSNAFVWPDVGSSWTQADKIGHVAAWDGTTGAVMPDFEPDIKGRRGYGAWAVFQDSTGRVWIGGDFNTGVATNGSAQWVGGTCSLQPAMPPPPRHRPVSPAARVGADSPACRGQRQPTTGGLFATRCFAAIGSSE